ncbi:hypothetical protein R3P38DRAFT_2648953 [Favolaschia claudopus]|uniref:Uncharacterized protein n=1 Tax=Favolaschia claudopus TaxID=2862362 RepID=A0AAW0A705_9AGAR
MGTAEKERELLTIFQIEGSVEITVALFGNVWKILCKAGDAINSADMTVVILEAMKTEIPVKAGKENVGRTVKGFGAGIREGASGKPGEVLVVLSWIPVDKQGSGWWNLFEIVNKCRLSRFVSETEFLRSENSVLIFLHCFLFACL